MNGELIRRARQADLVDWLRKNGGELIRAGQWWYIKGNDSLRIQGNKWYRNSQGTGGKSIDFLVEFYGYSFKDAVGMLSHGILPVKEKNLCRNVRFCCESLSRANDSRRVIAYLAKTRLIPYDIVVSQLRKGTLFQESQTGNAVFCMTNETGNVTGAEISGTHERFRFKRIASGSNCGYGYSFGQMKNPRYILFFESAIDLLSFVAISRNLNKCFTGCLLVSMAGLKPGIIANLLRIFKDATPVLCVDNDPAGHDFISRICTVFPGAIIKQPDAQFKDWNDQLCSSLFSIARNS